MFKEKVERVMEYIRANFQSAESAGKDGDFFSKFLPENQRMLTSGDSMSSTPALTFFQTYVFTQDEEYPKSESMSEDQRKKADCKTRNFQIKLLDYITYNINEGMYSHNFGLRHFFEIAKCNQPESAVGTMKDLLVILLRFMRADEEKTLLAMFQSESTTIAKIIPKFVASAPEKYTYNSTVLEILLKNNFIASEMQKDMATYAKFLCILLKDESMEISVKNTILHSIINTFDPKNTGGKNKEFRDAIEANTNLILAIVETLKMSNNVNFRIFGLSTLRSVAFEKEKIQNFLVKEGDIMPLIHSILRSPLRSPQIRLAAFSLVIILAKSAQNQEKIADQLKEDIIYDLKSSLAKVEPKHSVVVIRLLDICHKLIKQDSFRNMFGDEQVMSQCLNMDVFNRYGDEVVKLKIVHLVITYYDIGQNSAVTDDLAINFVLDAFLRLSDSEIENSQTNLIQLLFLCIYSIGQTDYGQKKLWSPQRNEKLEAMCKNIIEKTPQDKVKSQAKGILLHIKPPSKANKPGAVASGSNRPN
jgi:hypothetical protein